MTETFLNLLQIAFIVVGLLAIFLTFVVYNVTIVSDESSRKAFVLGNSIISSNCITDGRKGVFLESKLNTVNKACFNADEGSITITVLGTGQNWNFDLGGSDQSSSPNFNVLVKLDVTGGGSVKIAKLVVKI